ncbi:hypothetical protein RRG08_005756 [Elysia crispata]|uniref:Uncharacterized protein n=1 Tax=Elysia crispata TaxID=231223 RepID=A0AAE0YD48_9GAST|nr:hypothetical protein RRG08_005756 [Elysia crispata]
MIYNCGLIGKPAQAKAGDIMKIAGQLRPRTWLQCISTPCLLPTVLSGAEPQAEVANNSLGSTDSRPPSRETTVVSSDRTLASRKPLCLVSS